MNTNPDDPPRLSIIVPCGAVRGGLKLDGEREYGACAAMWRVHLAPIRYASGAEARGGHPAG